MSDTVITKTEIITFQHCIKIIPTWSHIGKSDTLLSTCIFVATMPPIDVTPTTGKRDHCHWWQYTCANRNCVSYREKCDGVNDCGDHSDEDNCRKFYLCSILTTSIPI